MADQGISVRNAFRVEIKETVVLVVVLVVVVLVVVVLSRQERE